MTYVRALKPIDSVLNEETYLAPNMASVLVDQSLGRIAKQQLSDDEKPDVFFAVQSLLQNVASVAVCSELHNTSPVNEREVRT